MSTCTDDDANAPQYNTALAFTVAPGLAALAGAGLPFLASLRGPWTEAGAALALAFMFFIPIAVVGYGTALVLAVPIYLLLPDRARRAFAVVVPLAGIIAAAPWFLVSQPWRDGASAVPVVAFPFALGIVAGVAFVLIRRPRGPGR